jgi:thiol-disulfide isomerase/thioredoxin
VLLRALVLAALLAALGGAWLAWRRPPRRLVSGVLDQLGVSDPAVVQFTSPSCAPCRAAAPHLRRAAEAEGLRYVQVDLAERPDVVSTYGIRTVPTIAVAGSGGRVVHAWTSLPPLEELASAARRARPAEG